MYPLMSTTKPRLTHQDIVSLLEHATLLLADEDIQPANAQQLVGYYTIILFRFRDGDDTTTRALLPFASGDRKKVGHKCGFLVSLGLLEQSLQATEANRQENAYGPPPTLIKSLRAKG
jgi:hypothetical protein